MSDEDIAALVDFTEKFVTATWHLLDSSETSGPIDDPTIKVWKPDFDEVSTLLDRCEGLPSGSTEHLTAGQLLAANLNYAITSLQAERDAWKARAEAAEAALVRAKVGLVQARDELDQYSRQEYPLDHPVHERYRQRDYDANPARLALDALNPPLPH